MEGTAVPRDRTASSSSRGPGPLSILRRCGERHPHQNASCHQVWLPLQPAGRRELMPPRKRGPGDGEGDDWRDRGEEEDEGSCGCRSPLPRSRLGLPLFPLQSAAGAGGTVPSAGVYMGRSPPAPREAPGAAEEGRPGYPHPRAAAAAAADRARIGPGSG